MARSRPPNKAALIINQFLLSKEAGVLIEDENVTAEALKKAIKRYFVNVDLEVKVNDSKVYLINKRLVVVE